jgi:hypothetical protein
MNMIAAFPRRLRLSLQPTFRATRQKAFARRRSSRGGVPGAFGRVRRSSEQVRSLLGGVGPLFDRVRCRWGRVRPLFDQVRQLWGHVRCLLDRVRSLLGRVRYTLVQVRSLCGRVRCPLGRVLSQFGRVRLLFSQMRWVFFSSVLPWDRYFAISRAPVTPHDAMPSATRLDTTENAECAEVNQSHLPLRDRCVLRG